MEEKLTQMRSYWLGRQSEAERTALEDLWFDSDDDSELLTAVRDDLIEDYLSNDLTAEESSQFKTFFLGELGMSREVGLAATIREAGPSREPVETISPIDEYFTSILDGVRNLFFGTLTPAAAGAFLIIIAVGGFVGYRLFNSGSDEPIAQVDPPQINETPLPAQEIGTPDVQIPSPELAQGSKDKNTNKPNDLPRGPKSDNFDLSDAVTMGSDKIPTKDLPESVESLSIKLARPLLNPQFKEKYSYRITPIGSSGGTVSGSISQDLNKLTSDDSFFLTIPAKRLRSGSYELTFFGQNANGQAERLSGLKFKINRKPTK